MRTILAVLILGAAVTLNAAAAFAERTADHEQIFFGDGFDNTTCADLPQGKCVGNEVSR